MEITSKVSSDNNEKDLKKRASKIISLKEANSAITNIEAFAIDAAKAKQRLATMMKPVIQSYQKALTSALPSINAMIEMRKSIEPALLSIAESARIAKEFQNMMLEKHLAELNRVSLDIHQPFIDLSSILLEQRGIMKNIESIEAPKIDIETLVSSTRLDAENRIKALETTIQKLKKKIQKEEQESSKKDELIQDLRRIIRELQEKTKDFYIS